MDYANEAMIQVKTTITINGNCVESIISRLDYAKRKTGTQSMTRPHHATLQLQLGSRVCQTEFSRSFRVPLQGDVQPLGLFRPTPTAIFQGSVQQAASVVNSRYEKAAQKKFANFRMAIGLREVQTLGAHKECLHHAFRGLHLSQSTLETHLFTR